MNEAGFAVNNERPNRGDRPGPAKRSGRGSSYLVAASRLGLGAALALIVACGDASITPPADNLYGTWTWDGSSWRQQAGPEFANTIGSVVYDGNTRKILRVASPPVFDSGPTTTATWDGTSWALLKLDTSPPPGDNLAYDTARHRVVLFNGGGDTWQWDGTSWRNATPAFSPKWRHFPSMAYDEAHRETVLFGGG